MLVKYFLRIESLNFLRLVFLVGSFSSTAGFESSNCQFLLHENLGSGNLLEIASFGRLNFTLLSLDPILYFLQLGLLKLVP
jgi:hypothetical protein